MVKVKLRPIASNVNLPTVIKTAILPGETTESLFIATQVGEIFYIRNGVLNNFLDIRSKVIKLGNQSGYDERGLLGLAFHPDFNDNGLFYLHYSVRGTEGLGALSSSFRPNPCNVNTLNLKWENRENKYDHIDTVEEWIINTNDKPIKTRTLLNLRRPFANHNGFNSLNFSPESGKLILTTGDGGSSYDPFNLSQSDIEIAGKIIEIDIAKNAFFDNLPAVTKFDELPISTQKSLSVFAKGVRNISGIEFQRYNDLYIKYVGNVGQNMVESIFSFIHYIPLPVTEIVKSYLINAELSQEGIINLGWRAWEGILPTLILNECNKNSTSQENIIAYYDETLKTSIIRTEPLTSYFHKDSRPNKFQGTALTGVKPYMGTEIPELAGNIIFTDLFNKASYPIARGVLAYTKIKTNCKVSDYNVIEIDYDFGNKPAYFVGLGSNSKQTKLFLAVYESMQVTALNRGTIYEIIS